MSDSTPLDTEPVTLAVERVRQNADVLRTATLLAESLASPSTGRRGRIAS